jgi:hypothetical protein
MKKIILPLVLALVLLLSACSSTTNQSAAASASATAVAGSNNAAPQSGAPGNSPDGAPGNPPNGTPGAPPNGGPGNPPDGAPGNPPDGAPGNPPDGAPGNPPDGAPGNPPDGAPGNPPGGAPGSSSSSASVTLTGAYTLDGNTSSETGQTYPSTAADESAILVSNSGSLTLTKATVTKSGDSSSTDSSSFYGLNAAVLASSGARLDLSDSSITSNGIGANAAFSTGSGSSVSLSNVTIHATGDGAHAVMATQAGSMTLTNVNMTTTGGSSSAIATDRGGGTISVTGGTVTTSGQNSAGIYSTGNISVSGTSFSSTGAEAAVVEGANSITLKDVSLTSSKDSKWGVMIYQSMSGDASGTQGTFSMTGGSLSDTGSGSPLFYVTNSTAIITLQGVTLRAASGVLVNAAAGNWGNSGSNGGTVNLTAISQDLSGDLNADPLSTIHLSLQKGASLVGAINAAHTALSTSLSLDASSQWTVTEDSYLTSLSGATITGTQVTNITGNGHNVYYDASNSANLALNGLTYSLVGGGSLSPAP